jgi:hypothetical protein
MDNFKALPNANRYSLIALAGKAWPFRSEISDFII